MNEFDSLYAECLACRACELHKTRIKPVFGEGKQNARILFVGEAPGAKEDLSGKPFVGKAGKMLDRYFEAAGFSRKDVFITSVVKCRPPANRDPSLAEQNACENFLKRQIELIEPKVIVCLGRISATRLIRKGYKITKEHGQWIEKDGVFLTAVYHPALLLRDPRRHDEMLNDLKMIKEFADKLN